MLDLLEFGLVLMGAASGLDRSKTSFYSRRAGTGFSSTCKRRASVTYFSSCEPAV